MAASSTAGRGRREPNRRPSSSPGAIPAGATTASARLLRRPSASCPCLDTRWKPITSFRSKMRLSWPAATGCSSSTRIAKAASRSGSGASNRRPAESVSPVTASPGAAAGARPGSLRRRAGSLVDGHPRLRFRSSSARASRPARGPTSPSPSNSPVTPLEPQVRGRRPAGGFLRHRSGERHGIPQKQATRG